MSAGPFFDVPPETPSARCRSCGRAIYWIVTAAGRRMPVDCDVDGGVAPSRSYRDTETGPDVNHVFGRRGRGVSHFATCAQAADWRQPRAPGEARP